MLSMNARGGTLRIFLIGLAVVAFLAVSALPAHANDPVASAAASTAAASLAAVDPPIPTAEAAAQAAADKQAIAHAAQSGSCAAQILNREGNFSTLRVTSYKYKFVKIKKGKNKGKYKRKIVKYRPAVKVSCARQCVAVAKKKGKYVNVYTVKKVKRKVRKRGKIVTVKKRARVYKFTDCANLPTAEALGTPVKIDLLPGSYALLDFGSFTRQATVSGNVRGYIPGKFKPNTDIKVFLTKSNVTVGTTPVFIDDDCNNQVSTSLRTGQPTRVLLDTTKESSSTLLASGTATAIVSVRIQLPLELRNDDSGCNDSYIRTGYSEFTHTFFFRGKVGPAGLVKLQVSSPQDTLSVVACLTPGTPTQPCNGFQVPVPILISTKLTVKIDLSGKN
jgi:hypothetical protein